MSAHGQEIRSVLTPENRALWTSLRFWSECNDTLSISKHDFSVDNGDGKVHAKTKTLAPIRDRLLHDGYALVDDVTDSSIDKSKVDDLTKKLKNGIASLHKQGIPATFILLYDETWEYAKFAKQTLRASTHPNNVFNFDVLAWYIDPKENTAGFSPHRDRQPEDTRTSFHNDNQAKYVTMWTALSNATPENSCLYVIPKPYDPGYEDGDGVEEDPLKRALPTKESYQHIRAMPRQSGQSVLFTHRTLHWGSRGNSTTSDEPRIAISFVCSDSTFEPPYVNSNYFDGDRIPPFRIRLLLVCAQLLIYYQRFDLPKSCIRACYEYCKEHETELDPTYRGKVGVEFVKAMKETTADEKSAVEQAVLEDDEDDAMLEEMLEAEEKGYGEFEDDYDELDPHHVGIEDDDDFDEDEEDAAEGALFGKRKANGANGDDGSTKKAKR